MDVAVVNPEPIATVLYGGERLLGVRLMRRRSHANQELKIRLAPCLHHERFGHAALVEIGRRDLNPGWRLGENIEHGACEKGKLRVVTVHAAETHLELRRVLIETQQFSDSFRHRLRLRVRVASAEDEQFLFGALFGALTSLDAGAESVSQLELSQQLQKLIKSGIPLVSERLRARGGIKTVDGSHSHPKHTVNGPAGLNQLHKGYGRGRFEEAPDELIPSHEVIGDRRALRPI